jgi:sterol desaturase/sphingolipid hydroxylase (fatty acid hydroxylase superfamily)
LNEKINNLYFALTLFFFLTYWMLETFRPYLSPPQKRYHHAGKNLVWMISIFNPILPALSLWLILRASYLKWGLFHLFPLPYEIKIILGILLIDLNRYVFHRLNHRVKWLWRFHQIHHSDLELDVTTSFRFHPLEFLFLYFFDFAAIILFGLSGLSLSLYAVVYVVVDLSQHANVRWPQWLEKSLSWLICTPDFHKLHHSDRQPDTDSNYGQIFSFWDRILRTKRAIPALFGLQMGLKEFRRDERQTLLYLLISPFRRPRD